MANNNDEYFDTSRLKKSLKRRSVRSGAMTIASNYTTFLLNFVAIVILARLLTPQDYGLIAMVTSISGFILMFKEMGLSLATIQKDKITHGQVSTLFWINVGVSVLLTVILVAVAPLIAAFFDEPKLTPIAVALAVTTIFAGLSIQHQALLKRQMQFKLFAIIQVASVFVGVIVSIIAAFLGYEYWALVMGTIANAITNCIMTWWLCTWRPGKPVAFSEVRSMVMFGANVTGYAVLSYLSQKMDNILIGKYYGADQLGFYAKAYSLLMMPIQRINRPLQAVAMPALSCLQHDERKFRELYLKIVRLIAYLTMPPVMFMIVCSEELILVVLGDQWLPAANIFAVLAIASFVQPVKGTTYWVYTALGHADRLFKWGLFAGPLVILSFFLGLPWGPIGVATSFTIMMWLVLVPQLMYCFKTAPVTTTQFFSVCWRPATIAVVAGLAMFFTKIQVSSEFAPIVVAVLCLLVLLIVGGGMFLLWGKVNSEVKEIVALRHELKKQKKANQKAEDV